MEQKYVKIIGLFLAFIMVMSILPLFFSGNGDNSNTGEDTTTDAQDAPGFEVIDGTHFSAEIDSISDGLTVTPEGVTNAAYVDYARIYNTPLQVFAPNITDLYSVYNTLIVKRYSASNNDGFAFEAHLLNPEVINFEYMVADTYNGYQMLSRGGELYNVIGTPTLLGTSSSLEKVIDVSSGTANVSTEYSEILSYVEPGAEYQMLSSEDMIADQHYLEFRNMGDGNYSRTEVFLNPLDTTLDTISILADNSSDRNLMYNVDIRDEGRIAKVVITANTSNFYNLAMEKYY
ncbi:hypothetical protein [Methanolobus bombayensis]|uniref:hypothetical protein n=1 Tax=Methanolobus bombayensis TaxID=38023 RepID=UPI001AE67BA0|nr:hypothetical protein [Methanolobus bombayensis]MBP1909056.1 hypothetical protein [Methanolobus bombayensis]